MIEGISKEMLQAALVDKDCTSSADEVIRVLLKHCKELDPWLPIDENTPKDKELVFITKEYGKVIGKWFDTSEDGRWTANCMPVTPTHYKLLPEDPE